MTRFLSFSVLVFFSLRVISQNPDASENMRFAEHLQNEQQYEEALYVLENLIAPAFDSLNFSRKDSVNYFLGFTHYKLSSFEKSSDFFNKVSTESPLYLKANYFRAFEFSYLKQPELALRVYEGIQGEPMTDAGFVRFQKSGAFLLKRDLESFLKTSREFVFDNHSYSAEERSFIEYNNRITSYKKKSPLVAGLLSAAVPGAGKFYSGYKAQAIASFIQVSMLGIAVAESYYRSGVKSPQFIVFGSFFSVFYIGNIWGSVLSPKLKKYEFDYEIDNNIRNDLHSALRRIAD